MSGAGCLNGYGYLGMVHAIAASGEAVVIPAHYITQCIDKNRARLMSYADCSIENPHVKVNSPPNLSPSFDV